MKEIVVLINGKKLLKSMRKRSISFSFLSLVVTKSEHRYNSHNPNFMQKKTVLLYEYVFPTLQLFSLVENETLNSDIVIDWP